MAEKTDFNALFGQMLTQWEKASNEFANRLTGSDTFAKGMNDATAASLKLRESMHEQMSRFLEATNQPSRDDLTELTRMVAALGDQLRRVEAKVDALAGRNDPAPARPAPAREVKRPPRTRRPAAKANG